MSIPPMDELHPQPPGGKAAVSSRGMWGGAGALVSSLTVLIDALAPAFSGTGVVDNTLVGAGVVGVVSSLLALFGRIKADRKVTGIVKP